MVEYFFIIWYYGVTRYNYRNPKKSTVQKESNTAYTPKIIRAVIITRRTIKLLVIHKKQLPCHSLLFWNLFRNLFTIEKYNIEIILNFADFIKDVVIPDNQFVK